MLQRFRSVHIFTNTGRMIEEKNFPPSWAPCLLRLGTSGRSTDIPERAVQTDSPQKHCGITLFLSVHSLRSTVFCTIRASFRCVTLTHAETVLDGERLYTHIYYTCRIVITLSRSALSLFGHAPSLARPCQLPLHTVNTMGICVIILRHG